MPQISSDIIKQCSMQISLDDIFGGFVERSRAALGESLSCCLVWKEMYCHISKVHSKFSADVEWVLDESSIFAQLDAFIQRCRDLLEVVEGQVSRTVATSEPGMVQPQASQPVSQCNKRATSSIISVT